MYDCKKAAFRLLVSPGLFTLNLQYCDSYSDIVTRSPDGQCFISA